LNNAGNTHKQNTHTTQAPTRGVSHTTDPAAPSGAFPFAGGGDPSDSSTAVSPEVAAGAAPPFSATAWMSLDFWWFRLKKELFHIFVSNVSN